MATNPYINQARADVGIPPSASFASLTWDEKQRYQRRLAELTVQNSDEFPEFVVLNAERVIGRGYVRNDSYSLLDAVSDFGVEFINQAEEINPLSSRNRGEFANYLMVLGAVVVIGLLVINREKLTWKTRK